MLLSHFKENTIEAGCDEAGRGCLAGPVYAAAVILPAGFTHPFLNDSKKLTEKSRYLLRDLIEHEAISWAVASVDNRIIDEINILKASILAMHKALQLLKIVPELILVDGNRFIKYKNIPFQCIVKGDATYYSIAAASVLAKTYRDDYMKKLHASHEMYGWDKNKGYPTIKHRQAIIKHGITSHHRRSYKLVDNQLTFDF